MDKLDLIVDMLKEVKEEIGDINEGLHSLGIRVTRTETSFKNACTAGTVVIAPLVLGVIMLVVQKLFF